MRAEQRLVKSLGSDRNRSVPDEAAGDSEGDVEMVGVKEFRQGRDG
jgi:hypothetical protein